MSRPDGKARGRPRQSSEVSLASCRRLDRNSAVPLYYQLGATLLENLEAGDWPAAARFATERELEEEFGVSQAVVRRALELLVGDGAIVRVKGSGTFVASRRRRIPIFGLIEALTDLREDLRMTLFAAREESPDSAVAQFLEINGERTPVAHVTAVIKIEDEPVGLVDSHTPIPLVPWVLDAAKTLGSERTPEVPGGIELTRAEVMLEHTSFGRWGGSKLGVTAGAPASMTRFIQFGKLERGGEELPLEFARLIYPSDATQISFELRR